MNNTDQSNTVLTYYGKKTFFVNHDLVRKFSLAEFKHLNLFGAKDDDNKPPTLH